MRYYIALLICLSCYACQTTVLPSVTAPLRPQLIKGLTMVAPPKPFEKDPMPVMQAVGATWVAIVPYAFTPADKPYVTYSGKNWQWWGERPEGVRKSIQLAKQAGLKIMLKPQLYMQHSWTGNLSYERLEDWESWENTYRDYIQIMITIATEEQVEMFCIGTEFRESVKQRPAFWTSLIQQVRSQYQGKITYSANWDDYQNVPFWQDLDYVGISAYYPLSALQTPNAADLQKAWQPRLKELQQFSQAQGKQILFTEFGYLSVDNCAHNTWELEKDITSKAINEAAQANALAALWANVGAQAWWAGGFLWKWFPNMQGHEGYPAKDYTPQGKAAEQTLKTWYGAQK